MKKRNCIGNSHKKGQFMMEGLFFLIGIIVLVVSSMFAYYIWGEVSPEVTADLTQNESKDLMATVDTDFPNVMNGMMIFVFMGFWAFVLIAAFMSTEHPIMFVVSMILLVFILMMSMYLTNTYEDVFSDSEFSSLKTTFTIPHWIMTHLLQFNIAIFILSIIIAIGKNRYEG